MSDEKLIWDDYHDEKDNLFDEMENNEMLMSPDLVVSGGNIYGTRGIKIHKPQIKARWERHKKNKENTSKERVSLQSREMSELRSGKVNGVDQIIKPKSKKEPTKLIGINGKPVRSRNLYSYSDKERIIGGGSESQYIRDLYSEVGEEFDNTIGAVPVHESVAKPVEKSGSQSFEKKFKESVKKPEIPSESKKPVRSKNIEKQKSEFVQAKEKYISSDMEDVYSFFPTGIKHNMDYPLSNAITSKIFTDSECDRIIKYWDDLPEGNNKDSYGNKMNTSVDITNDGGNYRKCDIKWVDQQYNPKFNWVFERIMTHIELINDEYFKYDLHIPTIIGNIQYTVYKPGNFYLPHLDWAGGTKLDVRKLSFSINLSSESSYEGGGLSIYGSKINNVWKERGTITVFPSFIRHEAIEVTEGLRFVLVGWAIGPTFI